MLGRVVAVGVVLVLVVAGCSEDAPSREDTVRVLSEECDQLVGALARLPVPDDVFELEDAGRRAFTSLSRALGELDAEGLHAIDDRAVQRYLDGALAANNAMADAARLAGFEDVPGVRRALREADDAGADLDAAAERLDLPGRCGRRAWAGSMFRWAGEVADDEAAAMTPTGDLVADVTTYCARYRRSRRNAPDPGDLDADRRWALATSHALTLFGERLDRLEPPATQADAFDVLTGAVADTADVLEPSETYAIDGDEARLQDVVEEAASGLRRVDALVRSLGVDC